MTPAYENPPPTTYCIFRCQQRQLALSVEMVAEVIEPNRVDRLPLEPLPLIGVCAYRGGVLPVIWSGDGDRPAMLESADEVAVLIVRGRQGLWGLAIDRSGVSIAVDGWVRPIAGTISSGFLVVANATDQSGQPIEVVDAELSWDRLRAVFTNWYGELTGCAPLSAGTPNGSNDPDWSQNESREVFAS